MADPRVSYVAPRINESGLVFIERDGQLLFSSEEIGRHLGYRQPSKSINILFNRNQKELGNYAVGIKLMSTDGKCYDVRHFTEEGVYILSMLANTPQARDFRAKLARLLREIRQQRLDLARQAGYQQGRDETLSLPALRAERQAGYLEGMREGRQLAEKADGIRLLTRARAYLAKGLTGADTARLLGISRQKLHRLQQRVRKLGV